ncbi:MAG: molybdenum cofactor guanylyltransferase [Chitinophagaceae bacterium]
MNTLLGVVLCGGESKRMGTDKGLIIIGGTIRAKYVAAKLEPFKLPVVFSVNESQVSAYAEHISPDNLVIDAVEAHGPLNGLLSVHNKFPDNDLLLLSCDILDLDEKTISTVLDVFQAEAKHDFIVYQDIDYAQPFCGIYRSAGLRKLLDNMQSHRLHSFSLQSVLNEGYTRRLAIINPAAFKNYNLS